MKIKNKSMILCILILLCSVVCICLFTMSPKSENSDQATATTQSNECTDEDIVRIIDDWLAGNEQTWKNKIDENDPLNGVFETVFNNGTKTKDGIEYRTILRDKIISVYVQEMEKNSQEKLLEAEENSQKKLRMTYIICIVSNLFLICAIIVMIIWQKNKIAELKKKCKTMERKHKNQDGGAVNELMEENSQFKRLCSQQADKIRQLQNDLERYEEHINNLKSQSEKDKSLSALRISKTSRPEFRDDIKTVTLPDETKEDKETAVSEYAIQGKRCNLKMVNGGVQITNGEYVIVNENDGGNTLSVYPSELALDRSVRNAINPFFDFKGTAGQSLKTVYPCILRKTAYNYVIEKKGLAEFI